jgi:hypothetical protein
MILEINILAIVVSALLAVAIGSIWYSPLVFGRVWLQSIGRDENENSDAEKILIVTIFKIALIQTLFFVVLSQFIVIGQMSSIKLTHIGALLLALLALSNAGTAIWERRSIVYIAIHIGYMVLAFASGLSVIALWPW